MGTMKWLASLSLLAVVSSAVIAFARAPAPSRGATGSEGPSAGPPVLQTPRQPSFQTNILEDAKNNDAFRRVVFTGKREQVVLMNIAPRSSIGEEVHAKVEQVFVIVSGSGKAIVDGRPSRLSEGDLLVVTPGVRHDIVNDGDRPLALFTIYAPPAHLAGRVHATKEEAASDVEDEQFGHSVE